MKTATLSRLRRSCGSVFAKLSVGSIDPLRGGLALTLKATEILTFDARQASLALAAGLKVKDSVGPGRRFPFGLPRLLSGQVKLEWN